MKKYVGIVCLLVCVMLFETSCKSSKETIRISETSENAMKSGEEFQVILEENITTGYSWSYVISDESGIEAIEEKMLEEDIEEDIEEEEVLGAGGNKLWTFKALKNGSYQIEFTYRQSWVDPSPEDTKVIYKIIVE